MKKKFREFLNDTDRVDLKIIITIVFLCAFGCMMVYSASSYVCATTKDFNYDDAYMLKRQLAFVTAGIGGMIILQFLNYRIVSWMKKKVCIVAIVLIGLLKTPLGKEVNGAVRWLEFGGFTLHVGEVTKVLLIFFLAYVMAQNYRRRNEWTSIAVIWGYSAVLSGLILIVSSNLSSCLIMLAITFGMTFIWSDLKKFHAGVLLALGAIVAVMLIYIYFHLPEPEAADQAWYQLKRIYGWMAPEKYKDVFSDQILQSLYAVGAGGFFGKGLGNSVQKMSKIPEPQNDMIFAIICEELGIFG
ncbi:MAG: FtsW/RodA/SpoVE family cell cycle protein, partial [Oscillospiraceae bacterium]|nr:FtsW/RodA/SpoVE family cell cycle protein [Oscillospiraceae bacterium]